MVKTLRITSVLIGAGAIVLLVFSVAYGIKGDPEVRQLLDNFGPIEQFEKDQGKAAAQRNIQAKHPLVAEAERYARLLNPPKPQPSPRNIIDRGNNTPPPPPKMTAKFDLLATCYNTQDPNRSYACVDEPGKGQYWVGVNEKIGHHVVREIRSGEIILWNGRQDEILKVPEKIHRSLLKGEGGAQTVPTTAMQNRSAPSGANPLKQSGRPSRSNLNVPVNTASKLTPEQQMDQMQKIMEKIKSIDANGPDLSEEGRKTREAMMAEIMERARHMGPQEASRLRRLGTRNVVDDAIDVEADPNGDLVP